MLEADTIAVRIIGWREGLQTIALIKLVRESVGLILMEAKTLVENVVNGEVAILYFPDQDAAKKFSRWADAFGAIVDLKLD